jgi:hypothetical protein
MMRAPGWSDRRRGSRFDEVEHHEIVVGAPPAVVYAALRHTDLLAVHRCAKPAAIPALLAGRASVQRADPHRAAARDRQGGYSMSGTFALA